MAATRQENRNYINPTKLLLSKWTAVNPQHQEKHFLVTLIKRDIDNTIIGCVLEAVINNTSYDIDWKVLQDKTKWRAGWL